MNFSNYSPADIDDELFLSSVPMEILMNSLDSQFESPLELKKKDYIQSFITKYKFSKDNMIEDDQDMLGVLYDQFMGHVMQLFEDYLDVSFVEPENEEDDEMLDTVHMVYRFFIRNIKRNFVTIIKNMIDNKSIVESRYPMSTNVTAVALSKEIDNEYDIMVLSNLRAIIDDILLDISTYDTVEPFFELCQGDEVLLELNFVEDLYDKYQITGNFIEKYIDMIDEDFKSDIQSKVRNLILKKYSKRKPLEPETNEEIKNDDTQSDIETED